MRVLVAIDYSSASNFLVDSVVKSKWPVDTQFLIVHVIESLSSLHKPANVSSHQWDELTARAQEHVETAAQDMLEQAAAKLRESCQQCIVEVSLTKGHAADKMILHAAKEWQAELIVIGCHGKRGLATLLLGSVSHSVANQATCSVRIVKHALLSDAEPSFNVLVPVDDTAYSDAAIQSIMNRPWPAQSHFRLLSVFPPLLSQDGIPLSGIGAMRAIEDEERSLQTAAIALQKRTHNMASKLAPCIVDSQVVRGDPREAILEMSYSWPAGLIVLGSQGKTSLAKLFLGSVSSAVILHAPCSVEVVRVKP